MPHRVFSMWLEQHRGIEVRWHCGALALQHAEPIPGVAEQRVLTSISMWLSTSEKSMRLPCRMPKRCRNAIGIVTWPLLVTNVVSMYFRRSNLTCRLAILFSAGQSNCCFETATGRRSLNAPYKAAPTPATTDQTAPRYAPSKAKTMPTVMYTYSVPAAEDSLNFAPQELQMCPGLFSKEFRFSLRRSADWHFGHE